MDIFSSTRVECSHDSCKSSVPYLELDNHESACQHAPCYCTEPGCSFNGPPQALVSHLADVHLVPVHTVHYGEVHQLQVSGPRCLLCGIGDNALFLLAVGMLGAATVVSVVCIRADAVSRPRYAVKISVILLELESVTSSTMRGKVAVEELPSFLMVPPMHQVGSGASKEVTLDIRIDKM